MNAWDVPLQERSYEWSWPAEREVWLWRSICWGAGGNEFDLFQWEVASWDFVDGGTGSDPPSTYEQYTPPSVSLNGGFSTDPSNPTVVNNSFFAVTATAQDSSGIRENGYQFTTWKKDGSDWTSETNWGRCNGADTVGTFADAVYMIEVSAVNNQGGVGYSESYYFEVDAEPNLENDLTIYSRRWKDTSEYHSDRDGVVEGWEQAELDVRLRSSADVTGVEATLVAGIDLVEIDDDYNWYGSIDAGEKSWGSGDFNVELNVESYSNMPTWSTLGSTSNNRPKPTRRMKSDEKVVEVKYAPPDLNLSSCPDKTIVGWICCAIWIWRYDRYCMGMKQFSAA